MDPQRAQLMQQAIQFLSDPQTRSSTLVQRIQFLESRGLTNDEITRAIIIANQTTVNPGYDPYGSAGPVTLPGQNPVHVPWDWRDYFIAAVVSGSVMLGAYATARKYLFPHLQPPTLSAYETDKEALAAQFDAAEQLLKEIQAETQAMKTNIEEQKAKVEAAVQEVTTAVEEMRQGEAEVRDEMREIRAEVNTMQDMLPKMLDRVKDQERQSYSELQQELKSLKTLLLSSRDASAATGPPSILSQIGRRPTIPAWQLAQPASASTSAPNVSAPIPAPVEKEPEE
ncbi:peroxisomal membrane protein pex14 [Serendipita sp. 399]|nr:peroxisomal membrane protein pex14 [Serendipita sp. 399]